MTEGFTIQLPKVTEKKLLARYDDMLQKAIEKALEDKELYKPMVKQSFDGKLKMDKETYNRLFQTASKHASRYFAN